MLLLTGKNDQTLLPGFNAQQCMSYYLLFLFFLSSSLCTSAIRTLLPGFNARCRHFAHRAKCVHTRFRTPQHFQCNLPRPISWIFHDREDEPLWVWPLTVVAVKSLKDGNVLGGEIQFQSEVKLISLAVHCNLLRLCITQTKKLLVYPCLSNASVESRMKAKPFLIRALER